MAKTEQFERDLKKARKRGKSRRSQGGSNSTGTLYGAPGRSRTSFGTK